MKKTFKILGIILCIIPMVGFGLCGLLGAVVGSFGFIDSLRSKTQFFEFLTIFGLAAAGLGVSAGFAYIIRYLFRSMKKDSDIHQ